MFWKEKSGKITIVIIAVLLVLLLCLFVTLGTQSSEQKLQELLPTESVSAVNEPLEQIETITYQSDALHFSMDVPADWTYVVQDGTAAYINKADGAVIKFYIMDYFSDVNNIDADTLVADIGDAGELIDFENGEHFYRSLYELNGCYYYEYTIWDYSHVVRVSLAYNVENAGYYTLLGNTIMETFYWEQENPIPSGYSLFYSSLGNFEFAYPSDWSSYIDNGIFTSASENQSYMQCTVTEGAAPINDINLDMFFQRYNLPSDCPVITFDNSGNAITAEIACAVDGIEYYSIYNILYSDGFLYEFTFVCPVQSYEADGEIYLHAIELFRLL